MNWRRFSIGVFGGLIVAGWALGVVVQAAPITKDDNTTALNLGASWIGGNAPGNADVAVWSGNYDTAGSLSAGLGAATDWGGISVGNLTGTAAGLVSIGGTGSSTHSLRVRGSGIDMSAANQNLVLNATFFNFSDSQTWNVASGRNLRLGSTGTGAANADIDGSATTVISISGGGVVDANQGGSGGFTDAAGAANYAGKWTVGPSTTLRGIRNGATAWGSNTAADAILLNGGTLTVGGISGTQGNWTWTTPVTVATGTTSNFDQALFSGTGRTLVLRGTITASGANTVIRFLETGANNAFDNDNNGFVVTADNALSSDVTVLIGGATENGIAGRLSSLRVGGVAAGAANFNAGSSGTLGAAQVTNNGVLTLSRTDTWTFGNNVSGSGSVRIGGPTNSSTQIVTMSGNNIYTGATTVNDGKLIVSGGNAIGNASAVTLNNNATAILELSTNEEIGNLLGGGATGGNVAIGTNALTVNSPSGVQLFSGAISGSGSLVKQGAGAMTLDGTNSFSGSIQINTGAVAFRGVNSENGEPSVSLGGSGELALGLGFVGQTATIGALSGTGVVTAQFDTGNGTKTLRVNQATNTNFDGILRNNTDASVRILALQKIGVGRLTLGGANSYTGATTIDGGELRVNGSLANTAVTINAGGTLGGSGTIAGTVDSLGGVIAPGTSAGTLSINNALSLDAASILDFELDGTDMTIGLGINDLINGVTNLTLAGTLNVAPLDSFAGASLGDTWRLIDYSGSLIDNGLVLGSLPSLSSGLSFQLDTATAGQVNLTIVPEPSSLVMLAFGAIAFWLFNTKRRGR